MFLKNHFSICYILIKLYSRKNNHVFENLEHFSLVTLFVIEKVMYFVSPCVFVTQLYIVTNENHGQTK